MSDTLSTSGNEGFLKAFSDFKQHASGKGIAWLDSIREKGITKFSELGFPTPDNEDWRFTNVTPIARTTFGIEMNGRPSVSRETVSRFVFPNLTCSLLVFVDGRFIPQMSSVRELPDEEN